MLSLRAETILNSIVRQYIAQATPVPSQVVCKDCKLGASPATIRSEMARLEQGGYVIRPHPSAGSIPSDRGYRYYVESLNEITLPLAEQRLISHLFHQVNKEQEEWLSLAATVIAQFAQNVAVVTRPKLVDCKLKHLELVAIQDTLVLLVLIFYGARVKQQLLTFDPAIPQTELTAMANKLNEAYSCLNSSQILEKEVELSTVERQLIDSVTKIMQAEDETEYEDPYLDGWHFILNQPEFVHTNQLLDLMELVEHRSLLKTISPQGLDIYEVRVVIGKENNAEAIRNCSVVISRYGLPGEAAGVIGVVGPTRMPYGRTISTVCYISSILGKLVAELYGRETSTGVPTADTN
ncbi:MAG: heat-inducible transcription repressor HrcA [Dehalococcoidia bacterium]|nr:MAG: heat-inducible transcription repressor HrcA [Dehalococcoidia bacterium]